jgi:protein-L-isoaspartate O-methyltransferase
MKQTTYHPEWQNNRINFILSKYPKEFFKGKRILEVGAYNGYIGAYFNSLGAEVHCLEGRLQNDTYKKQKYGYTN